MRANSPSILGYPTTLTATVSTGTNVSFTWDLGDESSGSGAVVNHIYPAVAIYTATVTASNSINTLAATTVVTITKPEFINYLPIAFKK